MAVGKRTTVWTILGTITGALGMVLTIISMATPYWIQSWLDRKTGVDSMGLWEICFGSDFAAPWHVQDDLGRRYADCNHVLSYELRTLRKWLFPVWFIIVEIMVTGALIAQLVGLIFAIVYISSACAPQHEHFTLLVAGIMQSVSGAMLAIGTMIYAYFSGIDVFWLPSPDSNFLSWSFALAVVAAGFAFSSAIFHFIDFIRLKIVVDLERRAETYAPGSSRY